MIERRVSTGGVVYYASTLLDAAGVPHAFSTRLGGVSPRPFDSLNLGNPSGCDVQDEGERIEENYRLLLRACGCGARERCGVHQVHGGGVVVVQKGAAFARGTKADALVSDDPRRVMAVRVADCVPVLIATADGRAVAAVHAGWRGVVAGVVGEAVRRLREVYGDGDLSLVAAVGPCIGREAFEVGAEVVEEFERVFGNDGPAVRRADGKGNVDLRAAVARQLEAAGIDRERIDVSDRCTYRDADEFYSHRRDNGITGRMAAVIGVAG